MIFGQGTTMTLDAQNTMKNPHLRLRQATQAAMSGSIHFLELFNRFAR